MMKHSLILRALALVLALCLTPVFAQAETVNTDDWVTFLLICNEGMNNSGGNAGNTLMVVALHPHLGLIRLMMMTWDTFIDYEGYDLPQKLDMPYRNNGPAESVKVFNANFDMDIEFYMSLNYLNLATMIDNYGGVDVDITRAERNALNAMVASKKENIQAQADSGLLTQLVVELLAQEYYLNDYGPDTHLNGLQAVGYGWLQYDSVYNCCQRDAKVVSRMFSSLATTVSQMLVFYTDESGFPEVLDGRRAINLDHISEEDLEFIYRQVAPIFQMSYNNLTNEAIVAITTALCRVAYNSARQGADIFRGLETAIFPIEANQPYETVAGAKGHLVDKAANSQAMKRFLYGIDD